MSYRVYSIERDAYLVDYGCNGIWWTKDIGKAKVFMIERVAESVAREIGHGYVVEVE